VVAAGSGAVVGSEALAAEVRGAAGPAAVGNE